MIDLANRLTQETRIGPSSTTIVTTATYDGADNLQVVTLPNGNQVTQTYDAVGDRVYTRDLMATDRSELYGYDARNRLPNFERGTLNTAGDDITTPLVDPALPSQQQWTDLDRRGNWLDFSTTLNGQPAVQQTRTVNSVNEITTLDPDGPSGGQSAVTLANDNNGNLTENPWAFNAGDSGTPTGQKYEYDEENRLTRVRRLTSNEILLEIAYDAFGRRVESKEYMDGTGQPLSPARVTHHVVLGPMAIEEYTITAGPTATLAREFVWGTEFPMPVAIVDWTAAGQVGAGQSEVLHYLRGVLGNVVALTDASGNVVERYRYDPYGMTHIYNASGTGTPLAISAYGNPYAYAGQRYDAAIMLYHFSFRIYSPRLGRWLQRDPVGHADGLSLYEYVFSSPATFVDPYGLWSIWRWIYTGDGNAPDYVYRQAVDAAASWLLPNSPVRGGFVAVETGGGPGSANIEASWTMDSGVALSGGYSLVRSRRVRNWTGRVPNSRLPGPLFQSGSIGLEGGFSWSEGNGLSLYGQGNGYLGMNGQKYAGGAVLEVDLESGMVKLGLSRGPLSGGILVDVSKFDDYIESVLGGGDECPESPE